MSGPLAGVKVLDLTHVLAGPYVTYQLALLGAEVIKVERPGTGDVMRRAAAAPKLDGMAPGFVSMNAGKKSICIDLKKPEGRALVERLAGEADILVENFRPGAMGRLGLDAKRLREGNPRLIYCSVSGFGQTGEAAGRAAFDHVVQAATGMMMLCGERDEDPPIKVGFPVIDIGTGMHAVSMILAALIERGQTGQGRHLDISMSGASLLLMFGIASNYLIADVEPHRVGNRGFAGSPGSDTYKTGEGYLSVGANTRGQFETLCRLVGRADLLSNPDYVDVEAGKTASKSSFMPARNIDRLKAELTAALQAKSALEWEQILNANNVPAAKVRSLPEFLNGLYRQTGPAHFGIEGVPGYAKPLELLAPVRPEQAPDAPPKLGQDTREVLTRLGLDQPAIDKLISAGAVA